MKQELSTAGKRDALTDDIKDLLQRLNESQQFIRNHPIHLFDQLSSGTGKSNKKEQKTPQYKKQVCTEKREDTKLRSPE